MLCVAQEGGCCGADRPLCDGTAHCCSHCHFILWCKAGLLCCNHRKPSRAAVFLCLLSLPDLHKRQVKGLASTVQSQQVYPLHCPSYVKPVYLCPLAWAEQCQVYGQANLVFLSLRISSGKGRIKTRKKSHIPVVAFMTG